ncbi:kti12, chromatin associated [Polyrhizophydium stewartii]|uniref:Kti12, chromatin associated n=1 Tax=Polyrhizophydium stewartii TaxID=2732419 RepID=A0ABR4N1M5_9FUNG
MPLITVCGLPLAGKTTRAEQVAQHLRVYIEREQHALAARGTVLNAHVVVVNEEQLGLDKRVAYSDAAEEKKTRGSLLSAVERSLTKEDVVVCDSLNYIKGFRYQLYCVARALGTPTCTIFCGIQPSEARQRNAAIGVFEPELLDNLCSRFEEPDGRNRWDAPLFTVISEDASLADPASPISQQIVDAVLLKKPPAPNLSTVVKPLTETNYLHEMDKTLSDVIEAIVEAQKNGMLGNVAVPRSTVQVRIPSRTVTLVELRRLKRQYTNINKMHTMLNMNKVAEMFADYLNTNLA